MFISAQPVWYFFLVQNNGAGLPGSQKRTISSSSGHSGVHDVGSSQTPHEASHAEWASLKHSQLKKQWIIKAERNTFSSSSSSSQPQSATCSIHKLKTMSSFEKEEKRCRNVFELFQKMGEKSEEEGFCIHEWTARSHQHLRAMPITFQPSFTDVWICCKTDRPCNNHELWPLPKELVVH